MVSPIPPNPLSLKEKGAVRVIAPISFSRYSEPVEIPENTVSIRTDV